VWAAHRRRLIPHVTLMHNSCNVNDNDKQTARTTAFRIFVPNSFYFRLLV